MANTTPTSAIPIPSRRTGGSSDSFESRYASYNSVASSSSSSSSSNSPPQRTTTDKARRRRESLMSASFSKVEHTVINVGGEEGVRLITCVKAAQGFDWNQEIFLPSYINYKADDLERRPDPVLDIVLTDEEVRNMFPE